MKTKPRHQDSVHLVIAGTPAGHAWEQADHLACGNATGMQRSELIAFLASVIRTPAADLTPDSPLVQKYITEERAGEVIRTLIEMVDKLEACKLLAAMMGWNEPEKVEIQLTLKLVARPPHPSLLEKGNPAS